jgi:lactate permease
VFSVVCTALFLRFVWHPKNRFLLKSERAAWPGAAAGADAAVEIQVHGGQTAYAWTAVGASCPLLRRVGDAAFKTTLNNSLQRSPSTRRCSVLRSRAVSLPVWDMPALHNRCSARRRW